MWIPKKLKKWIIAAVLSLLAAGLTLALNYFGIDDVKVNIDLQPKTKNESKADTSSISFNYKFQSLSGAASVGSKINTGSLKCV